jgi:hypothetical protein
MAWPTVADIIIDSKGWTGQEPVTAPPQPTPKVDKVKPRPVVGLLPEQQLAEYAELAASIGLAPPDLTIEAVKKYLADNDIPVFSLSEVVAYMDKKAADESRHKCGWEWRPLRDKDNMPVSFGTAASRRATKGEKIEITAASDHYGQTTHYFPGSSTAVIDKPKPYDRLVPMHALRKVAALEKAFGDKVKFLVSDYALAPAIQYPDPFLMVVVENPHIANGTGRFVVDFWDEPGFGIEQQLAK